MPMLRTVLLALFLTVPSAAAASAFTVEMDATEKAGKPQSTLMFPATLTSVSPDRIKLTFELVLRDGRLKAQTPPSIVLDEAGGRQGQTRVIFTVQTPYENGHVNETGRVTFRVSANDPLTNVTRGDPQDVTLTVHTIGFYAPGPQLFGAMLAIGLAALILRRRAR